MIHFQCSRCGVRLKGKVAAAGRRRKCPVCGRRVRVPSGSSILIAAELAASQPETAVLAAPRGPGEIGWMGPYRVLEILGSGSTGIVFRAEDPQLQRQVALKVLRPAAAASPESRRRFLREARAVAALDHDHIVTIFHVGEDRGSPWLAMKLFRGESLKDRLGGPNPCMPADQLMRVGEEVADALTAAHAQGLIHRDVKPSNILLEEGTERVKLIDFGLALADDGEGQLTRTGCVVGTPAYMAPEQADGCEIDHRSDLYGLGCVLYRASTGRLPFEGATYMDVFFAQRTQTPKHPQEIDPTLPKDFSDLIMALLARHPDDRPASATIVRDTLRTLRNRPVAPPLALPRAPAPAPILPPAPAPAPPPGPAFDAAATAVHAVTLGMPALPRETQTSANPWADVVTGTEDGPAGSPVDRPLKAVTLRRPEKKIRWLWALLAACLGALILVLILGTRH
jgi:serine/threonine protein kinase